MAMNFEELDETTRNHMLSEFEAEIASGNPYTGRGLTAAGRAAFPEHMRVAIRNGNGVSLAAQLNDPPYWHATENYEVNGVARSRRVNVAQATERLAPSEFSTWYVRGLAKRLLQEGVSHCQAYRGAQPKWEPSDCSSHEEQVYEVQVIYAGHRAKYWPANNPGAVSIPFGPGCHHTIRRVN